MSKNQDLFTLIEHALPPQKYQELLALWRAPREKVRDEDWVQQTRSYLALGPDEDEGGLLWTRWRELVGWDPDPSPDEDDDDDWNYQPFDTSLHRKWSELERIRNSDENARSFGSGIGLSGVSGSSLTEIREGEEEELDEGERLVSMGGRMRNL
jgi:hypothetical protein